MVIPDRRMQISSFLFWDNDFQFEERLSFFAKTISHAIMRTTHVRIAVARLDSTSSMPILASMEVRAANRADKIA